jgi:3',5'-cyclic AMP phosphodiesterase CpdA
MPSISGQIHSHWKSLGAEKGPLGAPISSNVRLPDGEIVFFKYGCLWTSQRSARVYYADIRTPLLGNPALISSSRGSRIFNVVTRRHNIPGVIRRQPEPNGQDMEVLRESLRGRFFLRPIGERTAGSNLIGIDIGPQNSNGLTFSLSNENARRLRDRILYDILLRLPNGRYTVVSHHAVYVSNSNWKDFSIIHVTDIHVAKRIDQLHNKLRRLASNGRLREGLKQFHNWNDNFSTFIKYANRLHERKQLDLIIATGDLIDYLYEEGDRNKHLGGNFAFFKSLILGQGKFSDGATLREELRVPIYTTLGNHDYRSNPYRLLAKFLITVNDAVRSVLKKIPGIGGFAGDIVGGVLSAIGIGSVGTDKLSYDQDQFADYNLTEDEAEVLEGGRRPVLDANAGGKMLHVDRDMIRQTAYYFKEINRSSSYSIGLGRKHHIVMVDTKYDSGITTDLVEVGLAKYLGLGATEKKKFVNGFVNSAGFGNQEIRLVKSVLSRSQGLVIVGMHAPPLCHFGGEFSHFFREVEHRKSPKADTIDFLLRNGGIFPFIEPLKKDTVRVFRGPGVEVKKLKDIKPSQIRGWRMDGTPYFRKASKLDDSLAKGVADHSEKFLRLCVGADGERSVDLVLCGHKHRNVQYKLKWNRNEFEYYMDFYTENPKQYYNSREFAAGENEVITKINPQLRTPGNIVRRRDHRAGATLDETWTREVPKNSQSLDTTRNAARWWTLNRPLILLSPSLGPIDKNQRQEANGKNPIEPAFQGIRLINVKNDVIRSIRMVTHDEISRGTRSTRPGAVTRMNVSLNINR